MIKVISYCFVEPQNIIADSANSVHLFEVCFVPLCKMIKKLIEAEGEEIMILTEKKIQKVKDQNCYLFYKDIYSEEELRELVGIESNGISVDWRHVAYYAFNNFTKFRQDFLREVRNNAIDELINNNKQTEAEAIQKIDKEIQTHIQCFISSPDRLNMSELNMIIERLKNGGFNEFKIADSLLYSGIMNIMSVILKL